MSAASSTSFAERASDITSGLPGFFLPVGQQRLQVLPPAWARPAKYRQIVCTPCVATNAVVCIPVRSAEVPSAWVPAVFRHQR